MSSTYVMATASRCLDVSAALYEADGTLRLYERRVCKGVSPAEYLRSALYGGDATDTSIHKAIQNITGMYPVPVMAI